MPITKLCKIAAQDPPTSLLRCPKTTEFPRHPAVVQKNKTGINYFACTSLPVYPLRPFHSVFRTSTLHSNSFTSLPAVSTPT